MSSLHLLILQPQGRYKSRTVIVASWLPVLKYIDFVVSHSMYDMKRAVHKILQTELINIIFFSVLAHQFLYVIPNVESYQWCCMQPLDLYLKTSQALLCHIPCVVFEGCS